VIDGLQKTTKWDINKGEVKATKFGTGAHLVIPAQWAGKIVVAMLKTKWDESRK